MNDETDLEDGWLRQGCRGRCFVISSEWGLWLPRAFAVKIETDEEVYPDEVAGVTVMLDRGADQLCHVTVTLTGGWRLEKV